MSSTDFPTDLKDALERAGISQRELARACNLDDATVSRYVHGLAPTPRNAALIAEALGLVVDGPVPA